MKRYWKQMTSLLFLLVVALLLIFIIKGGNDYLNLEYIKEHRERFFEYVQGHYLQAVIIFIVLYLLTALILPGALALTVAGGMIFGKFPAVLYVNIAATLGAILAFFATRLVIGIWLQKRFKSQLNRFNREMEKHGRNYLLVLRILPIIPFFVVNYCAGLTRIPLRTFIWTTSLGVLPGSFIYAFAGEQLRTVNAAQDLFSWKTTLALLLLALFALLPVILHHLPDGKNVSN
ncbi:MAG TPA: TVP38/TMEM64 family protein [Desulfuromonadaceae bacterium]